MANQLLLYSEPIRYPCFFYPIAQEEQLFTNDPREASFLLLPFSYEYVFGSPADCYNSFRVTAAEYEQMQCLAKKFEDLSVGLNKKLIVFFYHDSEDELPFTNAIIFRTSWRRSNKQPYVFGMPAFVDGLPANSNQTILTYQQQPSVSFHGQSAPIKLPPVYKLRFVVNRLLRKAGLQRYQLKLWYEPNYLYRRAAILSLKKSGKAIQFDLSIKQHYAAYTHPHKNEYLRSMAQNAYVLCVAGFGNYSYRFYEALRESRIPLFVDSDCLLPCSDVINWKEHLVWIETHQLANTGSILLRFHRQCAPDQFESRQLQLKKLYHEYLTPQGFARYVLKKLNHVFTTPNFLA